MIVRACVIVCFATACSNSPSASDGGDADIEDTGYDAPFSTCGHLGDKGNSLGVGQYCERVPDCTNTPNAKLCSILGDIETHFCTKICNPDASITTECGDTMTSCVCNSGGQCGCTPTKCLSPKDAGTDAGSDAPSDSPTGG